MSAKNTQYLFTRSLLLGYLVLLLAACGGGGGGDNNPAVVLTPASVVTLSADRLHIIANADDASVASTVLSGTPFTDIDSFAVSPDGKYVAYVADETVAGRYDLYVSRISGSGSTLVSVGLDTFSDVADFAWAPDSQSLAYRVDLPLDDRLQLFRVNIDGSNLYQVSDLNGYILSVHVSANYAWSPDGNYLAYVLDDPTYRYFSLYIHDAVTAVSDQRSNYSHFINNYLTNEIVAFKFSPDSQRIAFRTDDLLSDNQYEILVMPSDSSSSAVRANGPTGGSVQIDQFEWSPDSRYLGQTIIGYPNTSIQVGINTYDLDTAFSKRVLTSADFGIIQWAQGSNRLAFVANNVLRVHDADADSTIPISHTPTAGENLSDDDFSWSPDDHLIAYISDTTGSDTLYIAPSDGSSAPAQANGTQGFGLSSLAWSGDSTWLGVLERDVGSAFHPGNWYIYDAQANQVWASRGIFTYESSQTMKWSSDSIRAVYSIAGNAPTTDMIESVSVSGNSVEVSSDLVATDLVFDYPAETLVTP